MRYMLDTNILVYMVSDPDLLSRDVKSLIYNWDAQLCMSAESVKELILAYKSKGLCMKYWNDSEAMLRSIEEDFNVRILPIAKEQLKTYARLTLNEAQGHKDPSDHIIIAHAMTERLPLISSDRRFEFYRKQGLDLIFNRK